MEIHPGTVIIIVYVIAVFIRYKKMKDIYKALFVLTLFVGNNLRMGYLIQIGDNSIEYFPALLFLLAQFGIVYTVTHGKIEIKKTFFNPAILLLTVLVANFIAFYVIPYKKQILVPKWDAYVSGIIAWQTITNDTLECGYYVALICFVIVIVISRTFFSSKDWYEILTKTVTCSKCIVVLGYLEFLITNLFHTKIFTDFFIYLFGISGTQQNFLGLRGFVYPAQGMTKEPGMFMLSLFYIGIFFIMKVWFSTSDKDRKGLMHWLISTIILISINFTLGGVIYVALLTLISYFFTVSKQKKIRRIVAIIGVTLCATFVLSIILEPMESFLVGADNYLLHRLGLAIQQIRIIFGYETGRIIAGSESSRFFGINYSLNTMMEKPLLGFGIGVLKCISGVVMMLSGMGILGFVTYMSFLIRVTYNRQISLECMLFFILVVIAPNLILNDFSIFLELELPFICTIFSIYNCGEKLFYKQPANKEAP